MRIALTNLKGGTGKTTSAVYLACVLATRGTVVLVDADPQGSASLWAEAAADLPYATVSVANTAVARTVLDLADRWDHVVVDTAPGQIPITTAALQVVELALVPITTGSVDLGEVGDHRRSDRLGPGLEHGFAGGHAAYQDPGDDDLASGRA